MELATALHEAVSDILIGMKDVVDALQVAWSSGGASSWRSAQAGVAATGDHAFAGASHKLL